MEGKRVRHQKYLQPLLTHIRSSRHWFNPFAFHLFWKFNFRRLKKKWHEKDAQLYLQESKFTEAPALASVLKTFKGLWLFCYQCFARRHRVLFSVASRLTPPILEFEVESQKGS